MSAILSQNKQIGENEQISETSTSTSLTTVRNSEHSATFNNIHVLSLSGRPLKYSCIWYMCQSYLVKQNVKTIHKGKHKSIMGHNQGRIQDLRLGGAWVGEGSGDRLRSPAGPGQSPRRGSRWAKPLPPKLWGFEELQTFIWTTILNQPHHFYQTKKILLWVLILSDNC